jgi:nitrite reductase/ring-hydroxylating ferredoxin subunit
MDGFELVGDEGDVREGLSEFVLREGDRSPLVIVRTKDRIRALGGRCAHKLGEMPLGDIEDGGREGAAGCSVVCPRHRKRFPGGLRFDARDGRAFLAPGPDGKAPPCDEFDESWRLAVYEVRVVDGKVYVGSKPVSAGSGMRGMGGCEV